MHMVSKGVYIYNAGYACLMTGVLWMHGDIGWVGRLYYVICFCMMCIFTKYVNVVNPRRACAARVTVVVLCVCVCVCVRGPHLRLAQLSDKVGILAVSVSCWLVFKKGVFRIMASFRR